MIIGPSTAVLMMMVTRRSSGRRPAMALLVRVNGRSSCGDGPGLSNFSSAAAAAASVTAPPPALPAAVPIRPRHRSNLRDG